MPLKVFWDGKYSSVYDLETYEGTCPGQPGDRIGRYGGGGDFHDAPIYRTIEGAAVLRLGPAVDSHDTDFFLPEELLVRAEPRLMKTKIECFEMESPA
jgi:hypothetical protein